MYIEIPKNKDRSSDGKSYVSQVACRCQQQRGMIWSDDMRFMVYVILFPISTLWYKNYGEKFLL